LEKGSDVRHVHSRAQQAYRPTARHERRPLQGVVQGEQAWTGADLVASGLVLGTVGLVLLAALGVVLLPWPLLAYLVLSLITFALYAEDKRRARLGLWRIPESRLHKIELGGGWPGALLAQWYLRHKILKTSYRRVTLSVAALHGVIWMVLWRVYTS
jgi:uncharacterized membrane protein YsdA (DUF1294 family)